MDFTSIVSYNRDLITFSRELRKNMTDAENRLWSKIRMKQICGYQFYRQKIIGDYIVDFYSPRAKLVIEVDGSQHYISPSLENDKKRDQFLRNLGFNVLRFNDLDVLKNIEGVVGTIIDEVNG